MRPPLKTVFVLVLAAWSLGGVGIWTLMAYRPRMEGLLEFYWLWPAVLIVGSPPISRLVDNSVELAWICLAANVLFWAAAITLGVAVVRWSLRHARRGEAETMH